MKRLLLLSLVSSYLFSCQSSTPKETAQAFVKALSSADLTTVSTLASTETKPIVEKAKKDSRQTIDPEESFRLSLLTENVSGTKAEVKNLVISIPLVKEKEGWKVVLSEDLLLEIQGREERLTAAKTKWEDLVKEYNARLSVLKDYITYKKSSGAISSKVQALGNLVSSISTGEDWTGKNVQVYAAKQQQLNKLIEEALEPSLAASSDLSLNYFVQISNAGDRIKDAEKNYQLVAREAHSPVYLPLPINNGGSLKAGTH